MSQIVSFANYTPPARYDDLPWTDVQIEESDTTALPDDTTIWTLIEQQALSPLDTDPADPESRNITTALASDTPDLWYRLIWVDASLATSSPTVPVQNGTTTPYASTDELFRILSKKNPSAEQIAAAEGDLTIATLEINAEIDWADDHPPMTSEERELCRDVCLNRAADLWRHRESAPGILGVVDESAPTTPGRYSWARYVARLSDLKDGWGIA